MCERTYCCESMRTRNVFLFSIMLIWCLLCAHHQNPTTMTLYLLNQWIPSRQQSYHGEDYIELYWSTVIKNNRKDSVSIVSLVSNKARKSENIVKNFNIIYDIVRGTGPELSYVDFLVKVSATISFLEIEEMAVPHFWWNRRRKDNEEKLVKIFLA